MSFLSRDDAPFSDALWNQIDNAVVTSVKDMLVGRRFLPMHGPVGAGASTTIVDTLGQKKEILEDGVGYFEARRTVQIPQLYEDFWLYWRDLEAGEAYVDLSAAQNAAQHLARREDGMIFYGLENLGIEGLLTAPGINTQARSDWAEGEGSFGDIAQAISTLQQKARYGRHTLVVSQDLFVQLQRIQECTGILESDRIRDLLGGRLFVSSVLEKGTAVLLSAQPQYMDLLVGVDISTAYTEAVDLNHHLRVLETAVPRIKAPDAIVLIK